MSDATLGALIPAVVLPTLPLPKITLAKFAAPLHSTMFVASILFDWIVHPPIAPAVAVTVPVTASVVPFHDI
jgi:hypothetical protein